MVTNITKNDSPNTVKMKKAAVVLREIRELTRFATRWINLICNAKQYKKP